MFEKARGLVNGLSESETDSYEKLKSALLREFRLTPQTYRELFRTARKKKMTKVMFSTLLGWKCYGTITFRVKK